MLPGGSKKTYKYGFTVLDCIWSETDKTYYIIDLIFWCKLSFMEVEVSFYTFVFIFFFYVLTSTHEHDLFQGGGIIKKKRKPTQSHIGGKSQVNTDVL